LGGVAAKALVAMGPNGLLRTAAPTRPAPVVLIKSLRVRLLSCFFIAVLLLSEIMVKLSLNLFQSACFFALSTQNLGLLASADKIWKSFKE
jgi:hypothetical protein